MESRHPVHDSVLSRILARIASNGLMQLAIAGVCLVGVGAAAHSVARDEQNLAAFRAAEPCTATDLVVRQSAGPAPWCLLASEPVIDVMRGDPAFGFAVGSPDDFTTSLSPLAVFQGHPPDLDRIVEGDVATGIVARATAEADEPTIAAATVDGVTFQSIDSPAVSRVASVESLSAACGFAFFFLWWSWKARRRLRGRGARVTLLASGVYAVTSTVFTARQQTIAVPDTSVAAMLWITAGVTCAACVAYAAAAAVFRASVPPGLEPERPMVMVRTPRWRRPQIDDAASIAATAPLGDIGTINSSE